MGSHKQQLQIYGENFGVYGPLVFLNQAPLTVSAFTHHVIFVYIPPGVGFKLALKVVVSGQESGATSDPTLIRYQPPSILSSSPNMLISKTVGGKQMTINGLNFGINSTFGSITLEKGNGTFDSVCILPIKEILLWNDSRIVFKTPPGQGKGYQVLNFAALSITSMYTFLY